jgi:RimJ/RimL family protein N-acetyltransferase
MNERIKGKKVILRRPIDSDAAFFARWYNEPDVMAKCGFTENTTLEKELAAVRRCMDSKDRDWYTITDKAGRTVGETGLLRMFPEWRCTDLTLIIPDPNDQGKGYGTEAITLMFERAFIHWNFNRIAIGVVGFNQKALRFYEKVGFKREGIQEEGYYCNFAYSDFIMMRILKREYMALRGIPERNRG